jgi:hypothetical protein
MTRRNLPPVIGASTPPGPPPMARAARYGKLPRPTSRPPPSCSISATRQRRCHGRETLPRPPRPRMPFFDKPRPGGAAVHHDERGLPTLVHLADTEADAQTWIMAHPPPRRPHRRGRCARARIFTYLQDPGHGWLIVTRADPRIRRHGVRRLLQMQLRVQARASRSRRIVTCRGSCNASTSAAFPIALSSRPRRPCWADNPSPALIVG